MPDSLLDQDRLQPSDDWQTPRPAAPGRRPLGLRRHLVGILLAALLPVLAAGGLALGSAAEAYTNAFEARLRDTARALSLAIDADIRGRIESLTAFATSPAFGDGSRIADPVAAHAHAGRVAVVTGMRIAVGDAEGRFLLHHQVTPGAPLPETGIVAEVLRAAIRQEGPVVSDLMTGPLVRRPVVAVVVPVPRADGEPPALSAGGSLDPEHFDAMLAAQRLEAGATATLFDAAGAVIARSDGRFRGTVLLPEIKALLGGADGIFRRTGLDGEEKLFATAALATAPGWTATVAVPYATYRASWQGPLLGMAGGIGLALLASGGLASLLARRLLRSLGWLAAHARGVALDPERRRGTAADLPPVPVTELEALRQGFAAAEAALRRRTEAERHAYATLAEKEAMLATAQQLTGVGGWTWEIGDPAEPGSGSLRWTEETYRIFGLSPGAGISIAAFLDAVPPPDRERVQASMQAALRSGRPYRTEHRILRPDGSVRIVEELASPEPDVGGRIRRVVGSCQDVTDRRMATAALADNAARLQDLLATLDLAACMARDVDGTIRFWSKGCELLYGWTAAEAMGRDVHALLGTVFPVPRAEVDAALARDGAWIGELRHRRRDGEEVVVAAHKALRRDAAGRPVAVVEGVTDVSALHTAREALGESEARLRLALEGAGLGIWEQEFARNRLRLDAQASAMTGGLLPAGVWLGYDGAEFAAWREAVHPADRARREASRDALVAGGEGLMAIEFRVRIGAAWRWIAFRSIVAERDPVHGNGQRVLSVVRDTTEAALRVSEARLRSVVDSALDAIIVATQEGVIVSANRAAARMFGHPGPEALVGQDLGVLMPAGEGAQHAARLARMVAAPGARAMAPGRTLTARRADGSTFRIEASVAGFEAGGERFVTGILRDVTDRITAERALAESEALHRATFEHAAVGIAQLSLDGTWLQVNDRVCAITGQPREALLGRSMWDLTHPDDRAEGLARVEALKQASDGHYTRVKRYLRPDGGTVWVNLTVSILRDADEAPRRLISVIEDISARQQAEHALASSEAEFRATFEQAAVGIAHVALDGTWLRLNDRFCSIVGRTREEMLGLTFRQITHPDDLAADLEQGQALLDGTIEIYAMEKRYLSADGGTIWVNLTVSLLRDAMGRPDRFVSVIEDIAVRKATEAALAGSEERYRTLFERMEEGFTLWQALPDAAGAIADFRLLERNDAIDRLTGRLPAACIGRSLRTLFPDMAEDLFAALVRVAETGEPHAIEGMAGSTGRWLNQRIFSPGPGRVASLVRDVTERVQAEAAIRDSEAMLRRVLDNLFAFVGVLAPDGTLLDANRAPLEAAGITLEAVRGQPFWEAYWWSYDAAVAARVRAACEAAAAGTATRFDVDVRMAEDSRMTIDFQVAPLVDGAGRVTHLIPSAVDITERKRSEEAKMLLAREVDHRAKNALAVVQSVLTLTRTEDPAAFKKAVMGRIAAMALAHTLLARENWNGADLQVLLGEELAAYRGGGGLEAAVQLDGPLVGLAPGATQAVAMAIHELATNAAKYGGLSVRGGHVSVSWSRDPRSDGLSLVWQERGGPPILAPPDRRGFGTGLIQSTVVRQLQGSLEMRWDPGGLRCVLGLPGKQVIWRTRAPPRLR
ncbi:PAS domain S-box protein [Dankookia sp. GCM10030260]|uniref:PAS domain S-box protein n=1 Tax=Dankookia sp. GCM10030260 TaxID=3273390 RepID=UPI003607756B